MSKFDDEHIGGLEYNPVRFRFKGVNAGSKELMRIGRLLLGNMKQFMQLSEIPYLHQTKKLKNGTMITTQSRFGDERMPDMDKIMIDTTLAKKTECIGFIIQDFPVGYGNDFDIANASHFNVYDIEFPDGTIFKKGEYSTSWDSITFAGFPDNGAKYIDDDSGDYQAVLTIKSIITAPIVGFPNLPGGEWYYDFWRAAEVEKGEGDPLPANLSAPERRKDGRGIRGNAGFKFKDGKIIFMDYGMNDDGDPTTDDSVMTPSAKTGAASFFMIPSGNDRKFTYLDELIEKNNYDGQDGDFISIAMHDDPFGIPCVVNKGTYKINKAAPNSIAKDEEFKIWLLIRESGPESKKEREPSSIGAITNEDGNRESKGTGDELYFYTEIVRASKAISFAESGKMLWTIDVKEFVGHPSSLISVNKEYIERA